MTNFVKPRNPDRFEGKYFRDSGGRLAERHQNRYPTSPEPQDTWLLIQGAANRLHRWRNAKGDLPAEALTDMTRVFEALDDSNWHVPRVYGFVCRYKIRFGSMTQDHYSEFSSHESIVDAIRGALEGERKLPRGEGDDSTGPWEIAWAPTRINHFRAFGLDPAKHIHRS
jgi:hypothetical protein